MISVTAAHVSGPLGQALAVVDGQTWLYEANREPRQPTGNDIRFFFDHGLEVRALVPQERPALSPGELRATLQSETDRFQALRDLLIGMDPKLTEDLRTRCMRRAERLLGEPQVAAFIDRRFIRPAEPTVWDPAGASALAKHHDLPRVARLYAIVAGPSLPATVAAIGDWGRQQDLSSLARAILLTHAYDTGLIAALASAVHDGDRTRVQGLIFAARAEGWEPRLVAFLTKRHARPSSPVPTELQDGADAEDDATEPLTDSASDAVVHTRARILQALDESSSRRRRDGHRQRGERVGVAALDSVLQQVEWIAGQFRSGHAGAAWRAVGDLAERQLRQATPTHLAQSLTNLATRPDVRGDVAFHLCELAEICAPDDPFVSTARAELHRKAGRGAEALATYDAAIARFPDNVVARNGRAETLRELGRGAEALAAYDDAIARFPDNVVARAGRAETLRELGRGAEALAAYDEAIARFPDDVFARTGRAETLRALGRGAEALAAYDDAIARFPDNVVARDGRAVVLAELGRGTEAREALRTVPSQPITRQDWVAQHILCTLDLRQGADPSVVERLRMLAATCPFPVHRRYFETTLAVARLALRRPAEARGQLVELAAATEFSPRIRATLHLVKAHAEAADGDLDAARHSLAAAATIVPFEEFRARQLRREIERRFGLGTAPALAQPADLASADARLLALEVRFVIDGMARSAGEKRRAA